MSDYLIPTIKSVPLLQRQLNALFETLADINASLTASYLTDELYAPLLTEAGALLELDP